ncbi:MAG: hypothetical protein GY719_12790, partial [bacterium]|nr:hypothetical protein [bacterium]
ATVDRAYVFASPGFDRNLSYVALTRHRHQLALYVDRKTFASGEQLRRVFAREPRKDLVRDYRLADAADLTSEPTPAEQPLGDGWIPSVDPVSRELTPERLDRLQLALGQLDQWDEISSRAKDVAQARHRLSYHGSLPDLDGEIRKLEQTPRHFDLDLGRVYRQPDTARAMFDQHASDHGAAEAYRRLREAPEAFGRLHGRQVLTLPTRARTEALGAARRLGSDGVDRHRQLARLREVRDKADRYRVDGLDLSHQRDALARDRSRLVDKLRAQAAGLDLAQLEGRLPARHLKTLRDLQRLDELHLQPLR